MSEHNNDPIVDRVRDGEATGSDLRHINTILPQILDEEGITIHSTDDDIPQIGRVTVELVEGSLMDTPLVRSLGEKLAQLEILGPRGDAVVVAVGKDTDLDQPFDGRCVETGETLHFPNPWALDINTVK